MQSGDPSIWASVKNIHRKTTGRVFGIVHPMAKMAVGTIFTFYINVTNIDESLYT
jgi:hypothetical protein